jgi:hypothetical protein
MGVGDGSATSVADGDDYSHWLAGFSSSPVGPKPTITYNFSNPVVITHYAIMSANAHPAEDPKDWKLDCKQSKRGWETLDLRAGEMYNARHQTMLYDVSIPRFCNQIRFNILDIRDATYQGGQTISTYNDSSSAINSFSADVQIAEIRLFREDGFVIPQSTVPVNSVQAEVILDANTVVIAPGPARDAFEGLFKADMSAVLGIMVSRIVIDGITAGSVVVAFTILPDVDGSAVSTTALTSNLAAPGITLAGSSVSDVSNVRVQTAPTQSNILTAAADPETDDEVSVKSIFFGLCLLATCVAGTIVGFLLIRKKQEAKSSHDPEVGQVAPPRKSQHDSLTTASAIREPPPLPTRDEVAYYHGINAHHTNKTADATNAEFHRYRKSGGDMTRSELKQFVADRGFSLTPEYLDGMWDVFDTDQSDSLSESEFTDLVTLLNDRWGSAAIVNPGTSYIAAPGSDPGSAQSAAVGGLSRAPPPLNAAAARRWSVARAVTRAVTPPRRRSADEHRP